MSTQEASKNILEVKMMPDEHARLFPADWQALPEVPAEYNQYEDEDKQPRIAVVKAFMKRCKGDTATDEEILELIECIKAHGQPVSFLVRLAGFEVVDFPEGKDPTVKDFFEGNFDPSTAGKVLAIVSYPHFLNDLSPTIVGAK